MKTEALSKGSAILTSLFIMILVAIAATAMSLRLQIDISRTQLIKTTAYMARIARQETLLSLILLDNNIKALTNDKQNIDNPSYQFTEHQNEAFNVKQKLVDQQGLFNLNNLRNKHNIKPFSRLLQLLNPKLNTKTSLTISLAVNEWITRLNLSKGMTQLDTYYAAKHYTQSHAPMKSVSEFRLIKGVTQKIYNQTLPFITALPKPTPINLNSATLPLLQTLGAGLSKKQAEIIIKKRGDEGFSSIKAFQNSPEIKALGISPRSKDMTLTSSYFLSTVEVLNQPEHLVLFTLIERQKRKKKLDTHIIQQTINTL
jgi:general secretion pathway protein K